MGGRENNLSQTIAAAPSGEYYLYYDMAKALSQVGQGASAVVKANGTECTRRIESLPQLQNDRMQDDMRYLQQLAAAVDPMVTDVELVEGRNQLSVAADGGSADSTLAVARLLLKPAEGVGRSEVVVRVETKRPLLLQIELAASEGKTVDVIVLQTEKSDLLLTTTNIEAGKDTTVSYNIVNLSPVSNRNEITASLKGENAKLTMGGLYTAESGCKVDNVTTVRHLVPSCESKQLFKGIADGDGVVSFSGLIVVSPKAQKTVASQTNRHSITNKSAKAYSKPQLEIYADDVKCSHGATTGQIDESQLFYMQQRGISEEEARRLLTAAFLSEVADKFPMKDVREEVLRRLTGMENDINEED